MEGNISRRKLFLYWRRRKKGKYLEKENTFFVEEKNNGEGKEGKYSENQDTFRILDA